MIPKVELIRFPRPQTCNEAYEFQNHVYERNKQEILDKRKNIYLRRKDFFQWLQLHT